MRSKPKPPLHIEIFQSQILRYFIHLIHSLLPVLLIATGLSGFALYVSIIFVLVSWGISWNNHLRPFHLNHSLELRISPNGSWELAQRGELKVKAYYSIPGLQVIRFEKKTICAFSLILLRDSADADDLRKLRVRLQETFELVQPSAGGL